MLVTAVTSGSGARRPRAVLTRCTAVPTPPSATWPTGAACHLPAMSPWAPRSPPGSASPQYQVRSVPLWVVGCPRCPLGGDTEVGRGHGEALCVCVPSSHTAPGAVPRRPLGVSRRCYLLPAALGAVRLLPPAKRECWPRAGRPAPGTPCQAPRTGHPTPATLCWAPHAGHPISGTVFQAPHAGHLILATSCQLSHTGHPELSTPCQAPHVRRPRAMHPIAGTLPWQPTLSTSCQAPCPEHPMLGTLRWASRAELPMPGTQHQTPPIPSTPCQAPCPRHPVLGTQH